MGKLRITEDTPTKVVLEISFTGSEIWRGWSKSLTIPLLFLAGSSIALFAGLHQTWWIWVFACVIFGGFLIVEAFLLYLVLSSERKRAITFDLHSRSVTRIEKLISGKEKRNELRIDYVNRVLVHTEEVGHQCNLLLESQNHPPLYIASDNDLKTLVQGKYIYEPPSRDASEIKSMGVLGQKIGMLIQKPVVRKLTSGGDLISEEVIYDVA
jgi:hypothetical protein